MSVSRKSPRHIAERNERSLEERWMKISDIHSNAQCMAHTAQATAGQLPALGEIQNKVDGYQHSNSGLSGSSCLKEEADHVSPVVPKTDGHLVSKSFLFTSQWFLRTLHCNTVSTRQLLSLSTAWRAILLSLKVSALSTSRLLWLPSPISKMNETTKPRLTLTVRTPFCIRKVEPAAMSSS